MIAIYSRKSKFTEEGASTHNQVALCKEYGRLHFDTQDYMVYEDDGFSGGHTDRPQFKQMLEDMKMKKFNVLICYRLDRVSRNIVDFSTLVDLLQKNDIAFVSIKEQFDTSTPMGRAMMYIALVFAQLERETIAERIKDNMLQLARTGRWLGGVTPTGFKSEAITYYDQHMNKKKMYQLISVPDELEKVKLLYEKYLELNSLTSLESWCLENHFRSKNNKYLTKSSLKLILTNPVYAIADQGLYCYLQALGVDIANNKEDFNGEHSVLVYNKNQETKGQGTKSNPYKEWIVAIGKHRGIISSSDWIDVQKLLRKNSRSAPRSGSSKIALLTPLLICSYCGSKLKITYKVRDGEILHHYYRCTLKERSRGSLCNIKNLNGKQAEELILQELQYFTVSKSKLFHRLCHKRKDFLKAKDKTTNKEDLLEKKLLAYKKNISHLTMKLGESKEEVVDKYILEEIKRIDGEIYETKEELSKLLSTIENSSSAIVDLQLIDKSLLDFPTILSNAEFHEKKQILRMLIESILWNGEKLIINIHD